MSQAAAVQMQPLQDISDLSGAARPSVRADVEFVALTWSSGGDGLAPKHMSSKIEEHPLGIHWLGYS